MHGEEDKIRHSGCCTIPPMDNQTVFETLELLLKLVPLLNTILLLFVLMKCGRGGRDTGAGGDSRQISEEFSRTRTEMTNSFAQFTRIFNSQQENLRNAVEKKLSSIQEDNAAKLEKMRETVDEKLHRTLETRLGESFRLVSLQLEQVQKGLGEMKGIAGGVDDLKRVLSNVKSKGVLGEYQLEAIISEILTPDQYGKSIKTCRGSDAFVEFAVKMPGSGKDNSFIWLPVDAKFPTRDYEKLTQAYEAGNPQQVAEAVKELEKKIKVFAKDIHTKYIDPPYTTDFAIMFLPFEGLYAEVLRIPGLFETVQRDYRVTITGPSTVSAFLNSLQMGFRTLAVEKRTGEIWTLLTAVRQEFFSFGEVLQKTKERIDAASREIDNAGVRSRAIERKLRSMESLPDVK